MSYEMVSRKLIRFSGSEDLSNMTIYRRQEIEMNRKNATQSPQMARCAGPLIKASIFALATSSLIGCAFPKCVEYSWFKDRMQDCVGQDVSCVTRMYPNAKLNSTMQLAQNQMIYKYSLYAPPGYQGDSSHNCHIDITVDSQTGKMLSGSWQGDCDHWSYCTRRESK